MTYLTLIAQWRAYDTGMVHRAALTLVLLKQTLLLHFLQSSCLVLQNLHFIPFHHTHLEENILMAAENMHVIHQHHDMDALLRVPTPDSHCMHTQQKVAVRQWIEREDAAQVPLLIHEQIDIQPDESLAVEVGATVAHEGSTGGLDMTRPLNAHGSHQGREGVGLAQRAAALPSLALQHSLHLTPHRGYHPCRAGHPLAVFPRECLQRRGQGLHEGLQRGNVFLQPVVAARPCLQQSQPAVGRGVLLQE